MMDEEASSRHPSPTETGAYGGSVDGGLGSHMQTSPTVDAGGSSKQGRARGNSTRTGSIGPTQASIASQRVRSQMACNLCRRQKMKCEGVSPCARCRAANVECIFTEASPDARLRGDGVNVEIRLTELEQRLRNVEAEKAVLESRLMSLEYYLQTSYRSPSVRSLGDSQPQYVDGFKHRRPGTQGGPEGAPYYSPPVTTTFPSPQEQYQFDYRSGPPAGRPYSQPPQSLDRGRPGSSGASLSQSMYSPGQRSMVDMGPQGLMHPDQQQMLARSSSSLPPISALTSWPVVDHNGGGKSPRGHSDSAPHTARPGSNINYFAHPPASQPQGLPHEQAYYSEPPLPRGVPAVARHSPVQHELGGEQAGDDFSQMGRPQKYHRRY